MNISFKRTIRSYIDRFVFIPNSINCIFIYSIDLSRPLTACQREREGGGDPAVTAQIFHTGSGPRRYKPPTGKKLGKS